MDRRRKNGRRHKKILCNNGVAPWIKTTRNIEQTY
jgi:hypothetical protein